MQKGRRMDLRVTLCVLSLMLYDDSGNNIRESTAFGYRPSFSSFITVWHSLIIMKMYTGPDRNLYNA